MGNSISHCKEDAGVRVKEALTGESTEMPGSDASDDAQSPAETAPAVLMEPTAEGQQAAGDLMERAKEAVVSARDAAESALGTVSAEREEATVQGELG
jgi:hypothetical protein